MQEVDTEELLTLRQEERNLAILDCRGPDYWRWERIPCSLNLRWKYIAERAAKILPDRNQPIVTYCDGITCPASTKAYEQLVKLGYQSVFEYSGGLTAWKARGNPTDHDSNFKIANNLYIFPEQRFYDSLVNCYLLEEEDCIILIDGPQQLIEEHEDFVLNFGKPIEVILTHAATGTSVSHLRDRLKARIWLHNADKNDEWLTFTPDRWLKGGESFGSDLTIIHTPGHSPGSITISDSRNKVLFTGDHVAGTIDGTILDIRKDEHARCPVDLRLKSLVSLLALDFNAILPFHYQPLRTNAHASLKIFLKGVEHETN